MNVAKIVYEGLRSYKVWVDVSMDAPFQSSHENEMLRNSTLSNYKEYKMDETRTLEIEGPVNEENGHTPCVFEDLGRFLQKASALKTSISVKKSAENCFDFISIVGGMSGVSHEICVSFQDGKVDYKAEGGYRNNLPLEVIEQRLCKSNICLTFLRKGKNTYFVQRGVANNFVYGCYSIPTDRLNEETNNNKKDFYIIYFGDGGCVETQTNAAGEAYGKMKCFDKNKKLIFDGEAPIGMSLKSCYNVSLKRFYDNNVSIYADKKEKADNKAAAENKKKQEEDEKQAKRRRVEEDKKLDNALKEEKELKESHIKVAPILKDVNAMTEKEAKEHYTSLNLSAKKLKEKMRPWTDQPATPSSSSSKKRKR